MKKARTIVKILYNLINCYGSEPDALDLTTSARDVTHYWENFLGGCGTHSFHCFGH